MGDDNQQNSAGTSVFGDPGDQNVGLQQADQGSGNDGQQTQDQVGGQQQAQGGQSTGINWTPEMLQTIVAESVKGAVSAQQPQQQQLTMSDEEFNRTFHIITVKPEDVADLGISPELAPKAAARLNAFLQGTVKQALAIAAYQQNQVIRDLETRMTPMQKFMEAENMRRLESEFMTQFPDLKGQENLLRLVRAQYENMGHRFPNKETAFKTIAEEARKLRQRIAGGDGSQQQQTGTQTQGAGKASGMPSLSGKGQQAGAGSGGSSRQQPTAKRIFG